MQFDSRITPKLTIAVLVVGMTFIGWVARGSRAQDPCPAPDRYLIRRYRRRADPPAPRPAGNDCRAQHSARRRSGGAHGPDRADAGIRRRAPRHPYTTKESTADPAPSPPLAVVDDPEKAAQAFVQANEKQAESQLKALTDEAEKLRTRLRKVEAGIKRWEALEQALRKSQAVDTAAGPKPAALLGPAVVQPNVVPGSATTTDSEVPRSSVVSPPADDPLSPAELPKGL